ncbi:MAG: hypothetical protein R3253_06990 [Longimicrobiales bacterium]|nr:hypothetical protein [Longimicrobiales bacterium]
MTSKFLSSSFPSLLGLGLTLLLGPVPPVPGERAGPAASALHASVQLHSVPAYLGPTDAGHGLLAEGSVDPGTVEGSGDRGGQGSHGAGRSSRSAGFATKPKTGADRPPAWSHVQRCGHLSHCLDLPPPHLS